MNPADSSEPSSGTTIPVLSHFGSGSYTSVQSSLTSGQRTASEAPRHRQDAALVKRKASLSGSDSEGYASNAAVDGSIFTSVKPRSKKASKMRKIKPSPVLSSFDDKEIVSPVVSAGSDGHESRLMFPPGDVMGAEHDSRSSGPSLEASAEDLEAAENLLAGAEGGTNPSALAGVFAPPVTTLGPFAVLIDDEGHDSWPSSGRSHLGSDAAAEINEEEEEETERLLSGMQGGVNQSALFGVFSTLVPPSPSAPVMMSPPMRVVSELPPTAENPCQQPSSLIDFASFDPSKASRAPIVLSSHYCLSHRDDSCRVSGDVVNGDEGSYNEG